jgi:hypothetical protein
MTMTTDRQTEKKVLRIKGKRWCELQVRLENGRLSICGSEGRIVSRAAAKKEAREYWQSFFEEEPSELERMAIEYGTRTPKSAAARVQRVDGEYHGLDVHAAFPAALLLTESCGQIRETLAEWFPEVVPFLKYHLNDMHAECEHQEARGETIRLHLSAECPDCGYKLGSAWLKRELPAQVVAWFDGLESLKGV